MILGGFLGMMTETGALDNGIAVLVQKLKGNEIMLIPVLMLIFSLGGTTYGMCEETVPFYALLAATMMAAGFDPMVGAATVLLGAGCGCLGSTVNPFAVGAAVDALTGVGIEVNQSIIIGLGAVLWIVTTAMSIFFVMSYAKKVKADKVPPSCRCRSSRTPKRLTVRLLPRSTMRSSSPVVRRVF